LILASVVLGYSQSTVVEWTFPNNPDDAIADGGDPVNLGKTITVHGGVSPPTYNQEGVTTNCASTNNWANGAYTKYWQIEFSTEGYGDLTFESQQNSFSPGEFGPKYFDIQYRIGTSGTWTTFITWSIWAGNHWLPIPPTSIPAICDNQPSVYIRWLMTSNIPTQGSGLVLNEAHNRIDDIVIQSYCTIPEVSASPVTQTICPGADISPITISSARGVPGTTFSWARDNTLVLTGILVAGTSNPIIGTLYSTNPQQPETTVFTITAEANGCSSTTTASVTVLDDEPPLFINFPDSIYLCVQDIIEAWWDGMGDITPERPDYHTFFAGSTILDLDLSTLFDNCSPAGDLLIHWRIELVGGVVLTGSGQISTYPLNIEFPLGDNTIIYWLEDQSGNVTPEASRPVVTVTILARPDITRIF